MLVGFYGVLRDPDVLQLIAGTEDLENLTFRSGVLHGRIASITGEYQPVLQPHPTDLVEVLLIQGVSRKVLERMDYFADGAYVAARMPVRTRAGTSSAWFYVHDHAMPVSDEAWSLESWQAVAKPALMEQWTRRMALFPSVEVQPCMLNIYDEHQNELIARDKLAASAAA